MSDYPIHTKQTAPEGSQEHLAGLEQNIGFIPNLAGTIGGSPTASQGFLAMQSSLRRARLTPVEREVVGIATSYANTSEYSMAAHSTFALAHGAAPEVVAALRSGEALPDPKLEALRAFTSELLSERGHVSDAELLEVGYSRENVLEVITQVAYTTFANLVANVADTPVDEAFAPQAWSAAAA